jgi:hypothetical protein
MASVQRRTHTIAKARKFVEAMKILDLDITIYLDGHWRDSDPKDPDIFFHGSSTAEFSTEGGMLVAVDGIPTIVRPVEKSDARIIVIGSD